MCCHRDGADVPAVSFCVSKGIVGYCVGKVSGFLPLLESQSDHRIDTRGAARRDVASNEGDPDLQ